MTSVDLQPSDLDRIVVAQGPGSYTGLRVAVATAKTLAYTLNIELVGVSSLYALAAAADFDGLVVPIMDARRNNVYAGFYKNGQSVKADQHMSFTAVLEAVKAEAKVMFVGEVDNFRDQIEEALPQAVILPVLPSAYAIGKYGQGLEPAGVDSFVPNYLKRVEAEETGLKRIKKIQLQIMSNVSNMKDLSERVTAVYAILSDVYEVSPGQKKQIFSRYAAG